jgi:hypothetical protein
MRKITAPEIRFWKKVIVKSDDECWEWQGCRHPMGHGRFNKGNGEHIYAHRFSYIERFGQIAEGLVIHHKCFNPPCVNPDHLEAITHGENLKAGPRGPAFELSRRTHCPQDHEYTPENTVRKKSSWGRECRECGNQRSRDRYQKQKGKQNEIL